MNILLLPPSHHRHTKSHFMFSPWGGEKGTTDDETFHSNQKPCGEVLLWGDSKRRCEGKALPERADVTVCCGFLVLILFTPYKLCSVVRGAVSSGMCVCGRMKKNMWRNIEHLSSKELQKNTVTMDMGHYYMIQIKVLESIYVTWLYEVRNHLYLINLLFSKVVFICFFCN